LQLYRMGKIKKILITGGQGLNPTNPYSEAELLKRFLIMTGMPETDILIEEKSVNTRENALFYQRVFGEKWNSNRPRVCANHFSLSHAQIQKML